MYPPVSATNFAHNLGRQKWIQQITDKKGREKAVYYQNNKEISIEELHYTAPSIQPDPLLCQGSQLLFTSVRIL